MLNFDFSNRNAVVTGGTRGIGAAISQKLLKSGATVTAIYASNDAAAEKFRQSLGDLAEKLTITKFDVADYSQAEEFFNSLGETPIDILVNSAGIRRDAVAAMMPSNDWNSVISINLTGTFNMTKLAVLNMMRQRYGRIINLTSPSGKLGFAGQANYAASKAGIVALTKSVAREVARRKITVNAISPGFIDTDFISSLPPEQIAQYKNDVPMKRFGTAEEVANAALFLASEESQYITGAILEVTGGI
ncbi:MAG: SDR family oxidoreductase [Victivallales bacterium]|nr:SDR family oxidoreductase [Victivallales bacterium]